MVVNEEITERELETKIVRILSIRIVSVSQLSKELGVKRYILTGYLEAMKNQGKLVYHKVGKSNCYTLSGSPGPTGTFRKRAISIIMIAALCIAAQSHAAR
jgi:hypothetical protein